MNRHQRRAAAAAHRKDGSARSRMHRHLQQVMSTLDKATRQIDDIDYLDRLEQENALLLERVASFEREVLPVLTYVKDLPKLREMAEELTRLRWERARGPGDTIDIPRLPSNLPDVISLTEQLYGARIYFTADAKKSASTASFQDPNEAWRLLRAMATTLSDLYINKGGDIAGEFRRRTGFEVALHESGETKRDRRLQAIRTIRLEDGSQLDISAHTKLGVRPPRLLRVHYGVRAGIIIVGHCGDHLLSVSFGTRAGSVKSAAARYLPFTVHQ